MRRDLVNNPLNAKPAGRCCLRAARAALAG